MSAPAPTVGRVLTTWQLDPAAAAALIAAAAWYALMIRRTRRWPSARTWAFAAGLALTALALMSGLDAYADRFLSVHMVEHMVLMLAAAPALVAGAPHTLALRASRPPARAALARAGRSGPVRALTRPLVAFSLMPAALLATHLTPFYDFAVRHASAHALEHAVYMAAALLFWTPLLAAEPLAHRLSGLARATYLLALMPPMSLVAAVLVSADHPLYPSYRVSALSDQHLAGALMWVAGAAVAVGIGLVAAWRAFEREEASARAREAYEARAGRLAP